MGSPVGLSDAAVVAMRDRMTHRGPDDAGMVRLGHVVLAHRRLSVIDTSSAGHQPMRGGGDGGGGGWIVYNGEIYNDADVRRDLELRGVQFRTACDTETLVEAIRAWGVGGATGRVRGMFAFAWFDERGQTLTLARDPIGIKPLYYTMVSSGGGRELVFASEIGAVLTHPGVGREPDRVAVSAYLTTIRTTLGERTLYEGVRVVRPGEILRFDLRDPGLGMTRSRVDVSRWSGVGPSDVEHVRDAVRESVRVHLRADVPTCALLSGGLDSSIVCAVASGHVASLRTYCSGARTVEGSIASSEDFAFARLVASRLGVEHTEAAVTREMFASRWREMVERMGVPLGTPNEVAINEVARTLRRAGNVVALSGEGADEFFGGYDTPLSMAKFHVERGNADPGMFQLSSAAWVPLASKRGLLNEEWRRAAGEDEELIATYRAEFVAVTDEAAAEGDRRGGKVEALEVHLRFQQRVNLVGLLQRLDSATMLESVEGRTPLADVAVRGAAWSLPMSMKFTEEMSVGGGAGESPVTRTKIALREAFREQLPREVVERPKASFPLPFQEWVADQSTAIRRSAFLREAFTEAAIETVAQKPRELWALAWPMANLAVWQEK